MRIDLQTIPVLVLNAGYEAINMVTARRAFTSVLKGIAVVEEASDLSIRTGCLTLPVPYVIRLLEYRRIPRRTRTRSRRTILTRDHHTCQYCREPLPPSRLTLDHIVPRSAAERTPGRTW